MWAPRHLDAPDGAAAFLVDPACAAVVLPALVPATTCAAWSSAVLAAETDWTSAFDGEQFSLGRAFYTYLEEDESDAYFADPEASDACVERWLPGMQAQMIALVGRLVGGRAIPRRGWCGPGVHVFPDDAPVASRGGVHHYDTEGLSAKHLAARRPAVTVVAMIRPPVTGGGLAVWNVTYGGTDHPTEEELARPRQVITYSAGDVVLVDSYRLHQIEPFSGGPRISATVHAAALDHATWECWF